MDLTIVVHESGKKFTAEAYLDRAEAEKAFNDVDSGRVYLFKLRRNLAQKKRDFAGSEQKRIAYEVVTHADNPKALSKLSDAALRAEARKRKLSLADNPTARRADIIHQIQQHEQMQRSAAGFASSTSKKSGTAEPPPLPAKAAAAKVEQTSPPPPATPPASTEESSHADDDSKK